MSGRPRCLKTRKVSYHTELDAKIALAELKHKDKGQQRCYRCSFCRRWHLTSQERRHNNATRAGLPR